MKSKGDKLHTLLKAIFWVNILLAGGTTLFMLQVKGAVSGSNDVQSNVMFERYSIIISLVAIPLALRLFPALINKKKNLPEDDFLKSYLQAYVLRMAILDIAAVVNIAGFFAYGASNFVYLSVIVLFALCFTFPGRDILPGNGYK